MFDPMMSLIQVGPIALVAGNARHTGNPPSKPLPRLPEGRPGVQVRVTLGEIGFKIPWAKAPSRSLGASL